MTQEEKQLLIKDLCGRLPYGVKVTYTTLSDNMPKEWDMIGLPSTGFVDIIIPGRYRFAAVPVEEIKLYLRPMSSMTEEEHKEYEQWLPDGYCIDTFDWFNSHHFDHRGLIPMGLALEAPEGMYK